MARDWQSEESKITNTRGIEGICEEKRQCRKDVRCYSFFKLTHKHIHQLKLS